jgi:hypothetical protein
MSVAAISVAASDEDRVPDEYRLIAVLGRLAVLDDVAERRWELLQARCAQPLNANSTNDTEKPSELKHDNSNDDHGLVDFNEQPECRMAAGSR